MAALTAEEKIALIKENLNEVLKPEIIEDVIVKQNRPLVIYWGTATTGRPHCGYFVPMIKIAQFLQAGCTVKILLADIHGFLDNLKAPLELVSFRAEYYKHIITSLLKAVGVPTERLEFVLGSSYQLTPEYTMDLFRLASVVTEHDAKKAGAEVVKQVANPTLSGLIYPLMQALDEEYLKVDAQFGGVDQRKIFTLAQEQLPGINYKERAHLMNHMVPGLAGGKMSSSDPDSKIDLLDGPDLVTKKVKKAYAVPKDTAENGMISFVEFVFLPISALRNPGKPSFVVPQREGEAVTYSTIQDLKADYEADKLTPQLLKNAVTLALNDLLAPIQVDFNSSQEFQEIEKKAYPPPAPVDKKVKKKKDKGTGYPGGKKAPVAAVAAGAATVGAVTDDAKRDKDNLESITAASKATVVAEHIRRASAQGFLWLNPGTAIQTGPPRTGPAPDRSIPASLNQKKSQLLAAAQPASDSESEGLQQPSGGSLSSAVSGAASKAMSALGLGK